MTELESLERRVVFIETVLRQMEKDIDPPVMVSVGDQEIAFRFAEPLMPHFVFLHFVRIVSALNASVSLCRGGFTQEIYVLIRTVYEFLFKVDFVCSGYFDTKLRAKVVEYVNWYFSDFSRKSRRIDRDRSPRQREINQALQGNFERLMQAVGMTDIDEAGAERRRYVLSVHNNYVHGRYPEIMDMYGGRPPRPHLRGMAGTPKDAENLIQLDATIESAELTLKNVVRRFGYNNSETTPEPIRMWANNLG